jgi:hypothetical protein
VDRNTTGRANWYIFPCLTFPAGPNTSDANRAFAASKVPAVTLIFILTRPLGATAGDQPATREPFESVRPQDKRAFKPFNHNLR